MTAPGRADLRLPAGPGPRLAPVFVGEFARRGGLQPRPSLTFPELLVYPDGTLVDDAGEAIQQYMDPKGYPIIHRRRKGASRTHSTRYRVHILVCEAFHGPRPEGQVARHLNGKKSDVSAGNLAWGTYKQNAADSLAHGTFPIGERNGNADLTAAKVYEIRGLLAGGELTQREIARLFGVTQQCVCRINRRQTWAHLPEGGPS